VLSVLANGDPNHSFPWAFCPLFALVQRLSDNPSPNPPWLSSLDVLVPLSPPRESFDEVRKRLIAPNVRMSSVAMLNPDEAGAMGDEERLRKGLNRFLGFVLQLEVDPFFEGVGGWQEVVVGEGGLARVDADVSMQISRHGGKSLFKHDEADGTSIEAQSGVESNRTDIFSPSTPETTMVSSLSSSSSAPPDSRAVRSGSGANLILRALGMELLRAPDRG